MIQRHNRLQFWAALLTLVFLSLQVEIPGYASSAGEQKPKYGPEAVPLSSSHDYFKDHFPPLFWHMIPYYVPQQNGWSCGIASSVMILNAARSILKITPQLKSDQSLITEAEMIQLIQKNTFLKYKKYQLMGMTLPELKDVITETMKEYRIPASSIELVQMNLDSQLPDKEKQLHTLLSSLEASDHQLIIGNFNQGIFTGDADVGHYSPIAAYDSKNKKVLILDTDRKWYEPYWVSESTLLKGMKTVDTSLNKNRGYLHINLTTPH